MKTYYVLTLLLLFCGLEIAHGAKFSTGLVVPRDWAKGAKFTQTLGVDLPSHFDWKDGHTLGVVKNQGSCGSCWAHAVTEVEEAVIAIQDKTNVVLSVQELTSCDSSSYGCSGGYFSAFDYEKQRGLTYEKNFPYRATNLRCTTQSMPHDYRIFDWGYVGQPNRRPIVDEIKAAIFAGGPLAATVCADRAFMNYRSGVFAGNAGCQNHMIVLEGWDDASGTWVLRNSWGTGWGDKGFMKIKYGSNSVAQIAAFAVYKP